MRRRYSAVMIVAALLVFGTGSQAVARHQSQEQSMDPNHVEIPPMGKGTDATYPQGEMSHSMSSLMERMSRMMDRADNLSQMLDDMVKEHQGPEGDQMRTMQQMSQSIGSMAGQMKDNVERYSRILQDEQKVDDPTMQQQMQGFQGHLEGMAEQMSRALNDLQSMTNALEKQDSGK